MSMITETSIGGYANSPEPLVSTAFRAQISATGRRPVEELEAENALLKAENERLMEDRQLLLATVGIVASM